MCQNKNTKALCSRKLCAWVTNWSYEFKIILKDLICSYLYDWARTLCRKLIFPKPYFSFVFICCHYWFDVVGPKQMTQDIFWKLQITRPLEKVPASFFSQRGVAKTLVRKTQKDFLWMFLKKEPIALGFELRWNSKLPLLARYCY